MKKFLVLIFAVFLIAASCNRGNNQTQNENTNNPAGIVEEGQGDQDQGPAGEQDEQPADEGEENNEEQEPSTPTTATVTFTSSGYSPNSVTIAKGGTVTFVNNSSSPFWPASAPHPSHTDYPEFDPKTAVAAGQNWSFTFDKAGTWRYHDHLNPTRFGSVTVVE